MNDSTNTKRGSYLFGRAAFLVLFLIPAALTYSDDLTRITIAPIGRAGVTLGHLSYLIMLLACAIRGMYVHRVWLPLLP